jgi:hypothetical protein
MSGKAASLIYSPSFINSKLFSVNNDAQYISEEVVTVLKEKLK